MNLAKKIIRIRAIFAKKRTEMKKVYLVAVVVLVVSCRGGRQARIRDSVVGETAFVSSVKTGESVYCMESFLPVTPSGVREQVIEHEGYTVSFDSDVRLPNWVYWELTYEKAHGSVPRSDDFRPDPKVKGAQADVTDYRRSGWDRGHMAPAGDMKWSETAMSESCYFSNICPQHGGLNGGDWRVLEEKCRSLTSMYDTLRIVCGPIVGDAVNGTIGTNKVVVPDGFYKVMLTRKRGNYYSIGFIFTNTSGADKELRDYACSINDVEALTGIDFFSSLSDDLEERIEAQCTLSDWNIK